MSTEGIFKSIWKHIHDNGECTNTAKSSWGADRYELGPLSCSLQDDGYTKTISSTQHQFFAIMTGDNLKIELGSEDQMKEIYSSLGLS